MLDALRRQWLNIRSGLWFRPLLVILAIPLLAVALVQLEQRWDVSIPMPVDGDAVTSILTTLVGALITVVGVAFTLTIVAVQQVSSQFSPRAVRGVLARPTPKLIAGLMVGTSLHGIVTLFAVGDELPTLAIVSTIALAVLSLISVFLFLHDTSQIIQLENIAKDTAVRTRASLAELHPETSGSDRRPVDAAPGHQPSSSALIRAPSSGFVQRFNGSRLRELAGQSRTRIELAIPTGTFVVEGESVGWVTSARAEDADLEPTAEQVGRSIVIDSQRDLQQDPDFGLQQLADMAVRALSPGINDPSTAITCVLHLGAVLDTVAARTTPAAYASRDESTDGEVVLSAQTFDQLVEDRFAELLRFAAANPRVLVCVVDVLLDLADRAGASLPARAHRLRELARDGLALVDLDTVQSVERRRLDASRARLEVRRLDGGRLGFTGR